MDMLLCLFFDYNWVELLFLCFLDHLCSFINMLLSTFLLEWSTLLLIVLLFLFLLYSFSSVQSLSCVRLFVTPWIAAGQASLSITNSQSLPKLMSIELVMPSRRLILCHPLLLLPPIPPSIRVFSNESTLRIRWPKYWSFSFSIIPSNEHPGMISFRMDWLDLLAVQGTLKSLLQHHSSKASILHYFYAILHYVIKSFFFLCFEELVLFQDSVFLFIFV